MLDQQIVDLVAKLIDSQAIGLYPKRVENGPDYIVCPSCLHCTDVAGFAYRMHAIKHGAQKKDCQLLFLSQAIMKRATTTQIIDGTD
jgi:hypothetical protein